MSDYIVIWSGAHKTSLPGIGGIERRGNYLTDYAPSVSRQGGEFQCGYVRRTVRHVVPKVRQPGHCICGARLTAQDGACVTCFNCRQRKSGKRTLGRPVCKVKCACGRGIRDSRVAQGWTRCYHCETGRRHISPKARRCA